MEQTKTKPAIKLNNHKKTLYYRAGLFFSVMMIIGLIIFRPVTDQQLFENALTAFNAEQYSSFENTYQRLEARNNSLTRQLETAVLNSLKNNFEQKTTPYLEVGINYFLKAENELKFITTSNFNNQLLEIKQTVEDYSLLKQGYDLIEQRQFLTAFIRVEQINNPDLNLKTKVDLFYAKNQTYLGGTIFKKLTLEGFKVSEYQRQLEIYFDLIKDEVQFSYGRDLITILMYQGMLESSNQFVELFGRFYQPDEIDNIKNLITKIKDYYATPDINEVLTKTKQAFVSINSGLTVKPGVIISDKGLILSDASSLTLGAYYDVTLSDNQIVQARVINLDISLNASLLYTTNKVPLSVKLGNGINSIKEPTVFLNNNNQTINLETALINTPFVFNGEGVYTQLSSSLEMIPGNPVFDRFGYLIGMTSSIKVDNKNVFKPIYQFKNFLLETDITTTFKPFTFEWFDNINLELFNTVEQYDGFYYSEYDTFFGLLTVNHRPVFGTYNYGQVQDTFFGEFDVFGNPAFGLYIWDDATQYYGPRVQANIKSKGELYGTTFAYIGEFSLNSDKSKVNNINGKGYYFTENNNVFYGNHLEDERFGAGETFFYDGSYYRGTYTDTCNADGTYYYITGQVEVLPYRACGWG